jgi:hypothetical protein
MRLGRSVGLVVALALPAGAGRAAAQGGYEIQVYGADLVERGRTMLELHTNFTFDGVPAPPGGVASSRHALHATIEVTHGFSDWLEVGFYLFTSVRPGAGPEWVGDHLRPRVRAPASWHWPVGVSVSAEVGPERRGYLGDTWSLELRPIVDKQMGRWYWSLNPALERALAGASDPAWEFSPGATVTVDVSRTLTLGVEYYGGYGPLGGFDAPDARWQQLFPVVALNVSPDWELNAGIGFGLTPATDRLTAKVIAGRRF